MQSQSLSLTVDGSTSELSFPAGLDLNIQSTELVLGDELVQITYMYGYNVFRSV